MNQSHQRGRRLDWRQVGILYQREMRAAFREKTIVINSILIPIFLYPFIMWAAFSGIMFVSGQTEGFVSRVAVQGWPKEHPALRHSLEHDERIELLEPKDAAERIETKIRDGRLDAFVEFLPGDKAGAALQGNFQVRITFNESKDRSATARQRITAAVERYRTDWLKREAASRGISAADWQVFAVSEHNVASAKQIGGFVMGMVLPILFVVMVAVGCSYPAVDTTAGERERNTWETLMSTAASRLSIVTAKYLFVVSMGSLAGILNLVTMAVTLKPIFAPLLAKAGGALVFSVPLAALPVMMLAAVLLAGFVAAGMMIFASFARTFKEGQAMITPFYLVILLPVMFLQSPGLKFSLPLAFVPVVNVTMMVRDSVSGTFQWPLIGIAVAVSIAMIALCIRLATYILQFENVVLGSYGGSFNKFFRERFFKRGKPTRTTPESTP